MRLELPTLYGKSKSGKIKQWVVYTEGSTITVQYGQVGGKQTPQVTPILEGKNIGKANETSPAQQARSEAQSKWNAQYKKDYRESADDIPQSTLPPLAHKYQEYSKALGKEYDVLCKLNGVRCTMFYNGGEVLFQSRGGEAYPVIQKIANDMYVQVWKHHPKFVIDTELYAHGMFLEDITSCVKKHKKDTAKIKAYVFDMFDPDEPDQTWETRQLNFTNYFTNTGNIHKVDAFRVWSEKGMLRLHKEYVDLGYEGVVCRKLDSKFVFGHRTSEFLKYKIPIDEEFQVVRIDVDKNGCAVPWCIRNTDNIRYPKKMEFKAPLIGSHERQQYIAQHPEEFIDKYLNVVFESWTKYGLPGKPKGHYFRGVDEDGEATE